MPDMITSRNPNAFTPSMLCITSIALMGGTYDGLYFCEEACRISPLSGREYISWLSVSTRHVTVTIIWLDYANLRKLYCPVATCVLRLWHYSGATTTRRTLILVFWGIGRGNPAGRSRVVQVSASSLGICSFA